MSQIFDVVAGEVLPRLTLEAIPWGDGSSPRGFVNLNCPELEALVAQDVEAVIAHEMVRRWNSFKEAD